MWLEALPSIIFCPPDHLKCWEWISLGLVVQLRSSVKVYYFTKWIEVEPLVAITTRKVQNFIWKNIICLFGIPHIIITNNGQQFIDRGLAEFYDGLCIKHITNFVERPQYGQVEATNKVILN